MTVRSAGEHGAAGLMRSISVAMGMGWGAVPGIAIHRSRSPHSEYCADS
jgi:hypothetical protein